MLFPSVLAYVHDIIFSRFDWSGTTPTRMASMLIVVALIILELVFEVGGSPKEGLIQ
jgi:hypothetical protein